MGIETAISLFVTEKLKSNKTKEEYRRVLKEFAKGLVWVKEITRERVLAFHRQKKETLSEAYSAVVLAMVRSFCNYCWDRKWLPINPALTVRQRIPTYANVKNGSLKDFSKILDQIDRGTWTGSRDYLLLRLVFLIGKKRALQLKWNSEFPTQLQSLKEDYSSKLLSHLKETQVYWQLKWASLPPQSLFLNGNFKPIGKADLLKTFAKYRKKANLTNAVITLESLKRMRAKQIYEATNSLEAVKEFCEHKEMKRTEAFVSSLMK